MRLRGTDPIPIPPGGTLGAELDIAYDALRDGATHTMIKIIANYLGSPASTMLEATPFKRWPVEKSFEDDLDAPIIHYVFPEHGLELRCDGDDRVSAIFLYSDEFNGFDESLLDAPFSSSRKKVIQLFGSPYKSGGKTDDPILGEYGPWDRFAGLGYMIHVEYRADADRIKKITLMRPDVVSGVSPTPVE